MQSPMTSNPIPDLISDEVFEVLDEHDLLNDRGVRNYHMRRLFKELRAQDVPASDAIERVREQYASLQFDTVRKIVYRVY